MLIYEVLRTTYPCLDLAIQSIFTGFLTHSLLFFYTMAGDHGSQSHVVMGICLAFAILTFLVLALRLFARIYVLGNMGVDDCKCA